LNRWRLLYKNAIKQFRAANDIIQNRIYENDHDIIKKNKNQKIAIVANSSYKNDINYLISFIYNYTLKTANGNTITFNNINDANAFLLLQFLNNTDKMIQLNINDDIFTIKNIKIHPYIFNINENYTNVKIKLNAIQEQLYKPVNIKNIIALLAHEYYYINFDLSTKTIIPKYQFYINSDIISIIQFFIYICFHL